MNDPRVQAFLTALRGDLLSFFPAREADERLREIAGHLEQAITERAAEPDPVALALAEFGEAEGYRAAAEPRLARHPEGEVVRLMLFLVGVPLALDLLMDASSWLDGSDSSTALLSVPIVLFLAFRFIMASTRSRRFVLLPIMAVTMGLFSGYLLLSGWTRTGDPEGYGTRARGTAYHRRMGLIRDTLPDKKRRVALLERGERLFVQPRPASGIGEFRVAMGYLVPGIPAESRATWKGDPRGARWLFDGLRYEPVADYAEARAAWTAQMPELRRLARSGIAGEREEIAELGRAVASPWRTTVLANREPVVAMALFTFGWLLVLHGVGFLLGAISRGRRGRRLA